MIIGHALVVFSIGQLESESSMHVYIGFEIKGNNSKFIVYNNIENCSLFHTEITLWMILGHLP